MVRIAGATISVLVIACAGLVAPPVSAAETTTITMKVTGCEGCTITPATTPVGTDDIYNGPKAKVKDGIATFVVPTEQTAGMYFSVDPAWKVQINAQPLIVFQYEGARPGDRVTKRQAKASARASACWTGTAAATATLRVTVRRVWQPAFVPGNGNSSKKTQVPLAWAVPTQAAPAPFWPTTKGVLAVQDSVACEVG